MTLSTSTVRASVSKLLWTPREAAQALAISERTLWSLTQRGELPAIRIGRAVRYAVGDVEGYIARVRSVAEPVA